MMPFATPMMGTSASAPAGNPYGFVGAGAGNTTGSGGTSLSLAYPSGLAANDILIAVITTLASSTAPSFTPPAGWTLAASVSINTLTIYKQFVVWKRATGSESGSETFTITGIGTGNSKGAMTAWGGCVASGSPLVDLKSNTGTFNTDRRTTLPALSITTTAANQIVVNAVSIDVNGDVTPPSGYTERSEYNDAGGFAQTTEQNSKVYASAGATGTQNHTSPNARWAVTTFGLLAA